MKIKPLLLSVLLILTINNFAQLGINKDGTNPNADAILHVKGDAVNNKIILEPGNNGAVGIGETAPEGLLHLYKTDNTWLDIRTDSFNKAGIRLRENAENKWGFNIYYDGDAASRSLIFEGIGNNGITYGKHMVINRSDGNVGIGVDNPDDSAILELGADDKGLLIPRLTQAQRDAINLPQNGLLIYQTDNTKGFHFYNGNNWSNLTDASSIVTKLDDLIDAKSDSDGTDNGSSIFLGINAGLNDDQSANSNVGIGFESLKNNTSGYYNIANGAYSLSFNTTGDNNTASGYSSLGTNTTGDTNTANGSFSLGLNKTGDNNTANGAFSLFNNTSGHSNTANGTYSLFESRIGSSNVALGYSAGYHETGSNKLYVENSDATPNTALIYGEFGADNTTAGNILRTNSEFQIGDPNDTGYKFPTARGVADQVLQIDANGLLTWQDANSVGIQKIDDLNDAKSDSDGTDNGSSIFLGVNAGLNDDQTDNRNLGIGFESLNSNTTGEMNTANGYKSLYHNKANSKSVAYGFGSMYFADDRTTGIDTYNTAIGYEAQRGSNTPANNTGTWNTGLGYQSLMSNTNGEANTALGARSLYLNTEGERNSVVGYHSLNANTVGSKNTANGFFSLFSNKAGSNATAIGYKAMQFANNTTTAFENQNVAVGYETLRGSSTPANNTGNANTAVGYKSLTTNTSGNHNTAFGANALQTNKANNGSVAFGYNAMQYADDRTTTIDTYNTAIGYEAQRGSNTPANNTGTWNTSLGHQTLMSNTNGEANTALGARSLYLNTEGERNSAIGYHSLNSNTVGNRNTANGFFSLYSNKAGSNATAIGYKAMQNANNTTIAFENQNVAVGYEALKGSATPSNNTGNRNVALGYKSLKANSTGNENTASGYRTLFTNTTGNANVALGYRALETNIGNSNSLAIGYRAMQNADNRINGRETFNTAIGNYALKGSPTIEANTGTKNTAIGYATLYSNGWGKENTAIGFTSLYNNVVGNENTAIGFESLFKNKSGHQNTAIGRSAGYENLGNENVFIGNQAGYYNDGNENVFIGNQAGYSNEGNSNVFIGFQAGSTESDNDKLYIENSDANEYNALVYGEFDDNLLRVNGKLELRGASQENRGQLEIIETNNDEPGRIIFKDDHGFSNEWIIAAKCDADSRFHKIFIRSSVDNGFSGYEFGRYGMGIGIETDDIHGLRLRNSALSGKVLARAYDTYSDTRIKTNQRDIKYGLSDILKTTPKSYTQHNSKFVEDKLEVDFTEGLEEIGFIAQELHQVMPEMVNKPEDDSKRLWSINYIELIPVLVKSIQQQQEIIENYQEKWEKQTQKILSENAKKDILINQLIERLNKMEQKLTSKE